MINVRDELLKFKISNDCKLQEDLIFETIHEIIDELDYLVNKRIMKDYANALKSLNPELKFKFKTEFIFRALYFIAKKKYGFWILEQEGKKVDEIGALNINKSDRPILTIQMMNDLIKTIFYTNCDKEAIINRLREWESKFEKHLLDGQLDVGIPGSWNKPLESLKTVTLTVKSMIVFNCLVNDKVFDVASKGFVFYVKEIDLAKVKELFHPDCKTTADLVKKLNSQLKQILGKKVKDCTWYELKKTIAIPVDYNKVPDWIKVDVKTMMDKIFHSKYSEILSVIGISRLPSKYQQMFSF